MKTNLSFKSKIHHAFRFAFSEDDKYSYVPGTLVSKLKYRMMEAKYKRVVTEEALFDTLVHIILSYKHTKSSFVAMCKSVFEKVEKCDHKLNPRLMDCLNHFYQYYLRVYMKDAYVPNIDAYSYLNVYPYYLENDMKQWHKDYRRKRCSI